jgi:hypothetical protein
MNAKTTPAPAKVSDRSLLTEVHQLREFLIKAKHDYDRRRRVHHLLFKAFIKGMVSGLGVIAAVAIVSPIIVLLLRWVQWPWILRKTNKYVAIYKKSYWHRY